MNEIIYRQWHFARPALVRSYLNLLTEGSGDPIALQSPRRWGKTTFLLSEVMSAAQKDGFLPVYIDVWQNRADAAGAINYGLQEAMDDLEIPENRAGKRLRTPVRKPGMAGASIEPGEEPSRRRPESPLLLMDWLLKALIRAARRPILLLFDEIQELAVAKDGEHVISALRSTITKNKDSVRVIFTGSSQEKLFELFSRSRAALYEGASILAFPHLGPDFLAFVAEKVTKRLKARIQAGDLQKAFERLQYQPRALIDLVMLFASTDAKSLSALLDANIADQLSATSFETLWRSLRPLEQRICSRIAKGHDVSSADARSEYARGLGKKDVSLGRVSSALKSLRENHVINRTLGPRGAYQIDDPLFGEWLRSNVFVSMSVLT